MKRLTLTTAALTLAASAALAQTAAVDYANLIRADDIEDGAIYSTAAAGDTSWGADTVFESVDEGWNRIGEIEDVILDRSGQLVGIVGEIGGFLDIGDKHVFLPVGDVRLVAVDDDYAYVTRFSEEQLAALDEVDEAWWD